MLEDGKSNKEIFDYYCKDIPVRSNPSLYALIIHLHAKDRHLDICSKYNYKPRLSLNATYKTILKMILSGKENVDIMKNMGYNKTTDNSRIYGIILRCRHMIKIYHTNGISIDEDIV